MQLSVQIRPAANAAEIREAVTLLRPPDFWTRFLLANWYACAVGLLVIGADIMFLVLGQPIRIGPTIGLLAFVAGVLLYSWFRWVARVSKALRNSSERIQDLSLDPDVVRIVTTAGIVTTAPWSSYQSWLEGKNLFLLNGKDGATVLPVDDANRDLVRNLLQSRVR